MAGHNKWSKVKHRKAVVDKRRSKAWTMCARALISAARQGGGDPNFNFLLRAAIDEARYYNVPNDNIDRAIKKGVGGGETENYESVRYEGYGPSSVAVIVDALTNNRTRTAGDLRLIFNKHDCKLGVSGCVSHGFEHKGRLTITAPIKAEDQLMEAALEIGAEDVRPAGEQDDEGNQSFVVLTAPQSFSAMKGAFAELCNNKSWTLGECELDMIAMNEVDVADQDLDQLAAFIDALEDNEDVKRVYHNAK